MTHHFLASGLLPVLQLGTLAALLRFLVVYLARVPRWYQTPEGRYLVVSKAAFALVLSLGTLAALWHGWGHWPGRDYVRLAVFLILAVVFVWLNVVADQAWRGRDEHDQEVSGRLDDNHPRDPQQR